MNDGTPETESCTTQILVEGLLTTLGPDGSVNLAPMGPIVSHDWTCLTLRPFRTSTTYQNLKHHPQAVFHITDDVLLIAQAALSTTFAMPSLQRAYRIEGHALRDCCRWYELRLECLDDSGDRTIWRGDVAHVGRHRDFVGFHRARHAVLEATILATRTHLFPADHIQQQLENLEPLVAKTGGPAEREAFDLVRKYIENASASKLINRQDEVANR